MDPARRLARRAARAANRRGALKTLLLDVDGTLAPIAPTPGEAEVPRATLEALRSLIARGWRIALVSGRPACEIREMVPLRGIKYFGSHGLEGSWSRTSSRGPDRALARRLAGLARAAERLSAGSRGVLIERKPAGVALHDRKLSPRDRAEWNRRLGRWLDSADLAGLELLRGKRVLEIRPEGAHKGRVAESLPGLADRSQKDDSVVAIGDDRTDEDLFRAVGARGLTVRVGRPGQRTAAAQRLASPAAVRRFLIELADAQPSDELPRPVLVQSKRRT